MAKFEDPLKSLRQMQQEAEREPAARKGQAARKPDFLNPLAAISAGEAARAVESRSMAGQYKRVTYTLPPAQVSYIKQLADENGMSGLSFVRWLIDLALAEYENGARPEVETRVVRGEARMQHWTSQGNE